MTRAVWVRFEPLGRDVLYTDRSSRSHFRQVDSLLVALLAVFRQVEDATPEKSVHRGQPLV